MVFRRAIRLASVVLLIAIFIYWTITAYLKYLSEPVSTSLEHRLGDDNLGNFTLPVISFCYRPSLSSSHLKNCNQTHRRKIYSKGMINAAIDCMKDYANVSDFLKDNKIEITHNRK